MRQRGDDFDAAMLVLQLGLDGSVRVADAHARVDIVRLGLHAAPALEQRRLAQGSGEGNGETVGRGALERQVGRLATRLAEVIDRQEETLGCGHGSLR